ncbi:DNA primase [Streptomyces sp. uw30]|uniref:DNA primase n=1 Tax=Streptomyces sp. uw30 TaxID=1828179 RepID=UPI0011CE97E1|nr:DNA primase [Streptomyces sp. uw30]TXS48647.1 DNA primase [Streptomyces sp. uw30]
MNRVGLGLAVGAGYVLGRTKKMKLAFALGTLVAGKRMHLSPRALADLVSQQLQDNPQFKEIGNQLREDLRGVGQAASGAMVERQLDAFADRLHGRTAEVRDQLEGVVPEAPDLGSEPEEPEEPEGPEEPEDFDEEQSDEPEPEPEERPRRKVAKKAPAKKATAKKATAKKSAGKPPAKKTSAARGAARSARARQSKGGGER